MPRKDTYRSALTRRILQLITLLDGGEPVEQGDLARTLDVHRKTIRRDMSVISEFLPVRKIHDNRLIYYQLQRPAEPVLPTMDLKVCRGCHVEKPPGAFPRVTWRKDGRGNYCRPCRNERERPTRQAYRKKHAEEKREYLRQYRAERRDEWREYGREYNREWRRRRLSAPDSEEWRRREAEKQRPHTLRHKFRQLLAEGAYPDTLARDGGRPPRPESSIELLLWWTQNKRPGAKGNRSALSPDRAGDAVALEVLRGLLVELIEEET